MDKKTFLINKCNWNEVLKYTGLGNVIINSCWTVFKNNY